MNNYEEAKEEGIEYILDEVTRAFITRGEVKVLLSSLAEKIKEGVEKDVKTNYLFVGTGNNVCKLDCEDCRKITGGFCSQHNQI